ncbi:MAG: ABC transporter permease [Ignavibacteria bacterium]|nr:ABC transporter permease [Ignavibacteria bacterium]
MNHELIKLISNRYISRYARRGFINFVWWFAIVSIVLGVVALIISLSVLEGFHSALRENAIRFTSHIKIFTFDKNLVFNSSDIVKKLQERVSEIKEVYPVVEKEAVLKYKNYVDGVLLRALDENTLAKILDLELNISTDELLNQDGIIVGKMLATKFGLKIGDTAVLVSLGENTDPTTTLPKFFKVKVLGFYESGMAKYDELITFIPKHYFLNIFGLPKDVATSFDVFIGDITKINSVANKLEEELGYPYYCYTFYDLHSSIFAWIELQKEPIPLVLSLITIVAVFNVVTFLLINVIDKTKSIAVLKTLGLKRKEILLIFLRISLKIATIGTAIGVGIALCFSLLQKYFKFIHLNSEIYYLNVLPISISIEHYAIVVAFTFFVTILSSLLPSLFASNMKPVEALNFAK